jgi:tripartite-type tricarboxylate transporter receptor subunit TctC
VLRPDRRRLLALAAGAALATSARAATPPWPARSIRLVVPFPPGGGTDLAARIVAERLAAVLGQPVVIDNKPGASTTIGVMQVVDAEADGYTLLFSGSSSYTVNPAVRPRLAYDPFRQLTPIALLARAPVVLLTPANGPYKTLDELLADAARRPGQVNYATFGPGSAPHLATELLAAARGVRLTAVPYKGSAESTTALVRGDVSLGLDTLAAAAPQIRAGKLRALAVISEKRSPLLPAVPGYGELGLSSALFEGWYALAGPARLPEPVRQRLLAALHEVVADRLVRERMQQQSLEPALLGPEALRDLMDREVVRYRAIAARADIRLE